MSTQVQYRRGTGTQNNAFVGALGEITVDTTNWTLRVHDGITAGGAGNLATVAYVNSQIASLSSNSITDGTSNVRVLNNGNVLISSGGTANVAVISSTGLFVTGLASVTGNITSGNVSATNLTGTTVSASGTVTGASLAGTLTTASQTNITAVGTLTSVSVSGNVQAGNLRTAGLISATGAITGSSVVGGVMTGSSVSVSGTVTGASVVGGVMTGTSLSVSGAVTGGAITGSSLNVSTGNITGGNLILTGAITDSNQLDIQTSANNANIVITPNGTGNLNIGRMSASGDITAATYFGTIGTASQTNITAVGTLASLNSGSISSSGTVTGASVVGGVMTGSSVSVTGTVTGASVVGGVMTGSSVSVSGTVTGASVVGGVMTGSSVSVSGTVTGASVVGGVMTGSSVSVSGAVTGASLVGTLTTASQTNITAVGTLTSVSVSGNVQGGNLRTAGLISATGAITGANITGTSLTVSTGSVTCGSVVNANANGVGNIGSATTYFNTVFAKATSAQYADVAEKYRADADYPVGTVLIFGGEQEVTISQQEYSSAIAGTISENPAYVMNNGLAGQYVAVVALLGRVPCRVVGNISKGDLLVSSNIPGVATKLDPTRHRPGVVIGKALKHYNSGTEGVIEIVVGRM